MSDALPEDRDRVVETALRLLPVPDHAPDFWSRLDAALDAEPSHRSPAAAPIAPAEPDDEAADPATAEVPVLPLEPVAPLGLIPPAMRRPSNLVLSALAVAAAVVVVVAGSALLRSRTADDPADEVAEPASEGADAEDEVGPGPLMLSVPEGEPAAELVVSWVGHLAQGDIDAAWDALSPTSQDTWGSSAAFEAERTALAEGYGAWSAATADQVILTSLIEGELELVTLVGTVDQEGMRESRADAFPVRWAGDGAVLELYSSSGPVEIVVPSAADPTGLRSLAAGDEIVIVVPDHGSDPLLRIDSEDPVVCGEGGDTSLTHLEETPARRCGYQPEGLEPGEHILTVAHWSTDGTRVTAHSVRFTVS